MIQAIRTMMTIWGTIFAATGAIMVLTTVVWFITGGLVLHDTLANVTIAGIALGLGLGLRTEVPRR